MDTTYCQMFLIAGDDRHLLREGITIIGSAENDRYNCIRLQDKAICPKQAALKWSAETEYIQLMDLCSHSGTQMITSSSQTTEILKPLEWYKVTSGNTILFGSFKAQLENSLSKLRKQSVSFFADEDSVEVVDCSLEEAPQIKSRTERKKLSNSFGSTNNTTTDKSLAHENNSFVIPETQPMNITARSNSSSLRQINKSKTGGNVTIDDDDDMFYIPETQEQLQQSITDDIIEPITNTIGQGEKDDDFLQFDTQDDENTGDGMFNNPYIDQSQNLLHNMDQSYQQDAAKPNQRKSIIPDRSVDSISFHGKIPSDDTDDNLSKIVWNESKATDDRGDSVTPELEFEKPAAQPSTRNHILDSVPVDESRSDSMTPDLEFDQGTPLQKELTADSSKLSLVKSENATNCREQSITPDLIFERPNGEKDIEEAEISLNQEGNIDPYDLATQPILAEPISAYDQPTQQLPAQNNRKSLDLHPESAYELLTQQMPTQKLKAARPLRKVKVNLVDLKSTMMNVSFRPNKHIDLNPFELSTQPLSVDKADVYDLQTQQLPPQELNDTVPLNFKEPSPTIKLKRKSKRAEKLSELDQFAMPTQPLSLDKPKDDIYDLQTQLLPANDTDNANDTIPLDIGSNLPPPSPSACDPYDLQTQPLASKSSHTSLGDDDPEMSKLFRPKINSTYRQSILAKQLSNQEKDEETHCKDVENISPSSNKENRVDDCKWDSAKREAVRLKSNSVRIQENEDQLRTSQLTDEGLDEEYCLASTMPVAECSSKGMSNDSPCSSTSSTRRGKRTDRRQERGFKMPESGATSSTKSSLGMETPRPKKVPSDLSMDTDAFDFNTPEHPFLKAAKREKVLAISDLITSRTSQTNSSGQRNKYIFGDSSDEDEDPAAPVFQKEDSNVRVMKYDRNECAGKTVEQTSFAVPKPKSNRLRKLKNQHSDDSKEKEEKIVSKSKSEKSTKSEDKSMDYDYLPSKSTRKRKVVEDTSEPKSNPTDKAIKSSRQSKPEHEPKAGPSLKLDEKPASKKRGRSKQEESKTNKTTIPEIGDERKKRPVRSDKSMPLTIDITSSEDEQSGTSSTDSSGRARKSSRTSKPRLMFTKMSPEPYKRMVTRAATRKSKLFSIT